MGELLILLFDALYIVAACGAIILALWHASHPDALGGLMVRSNVALSVTAIWALVAVGVGVGNELVQFFVSATYLAWLSLLYGMFSFDDRDKSVAPVRPVVLSLVFVEFVQIGFTFARIHYIGDAQAQAIIFSFALMFRLLFSIGALVLVHNLYAGAAQQARQSLRWPAMAMAVLWLYDLNLYTIAYLSKGVPEGLYNLRSLAAVSAVALLGYGTLRARTQLRFQPSRSIAFRSFSLAVIGGYLVVMVLIAQGIAYAGNDSSRILQIGFVLLASALALAFLPSRKMRGWLRVTISKNLFQHRYDYRAEWLRFTDTIGRAGPQASPLPQRAVQAVADVTDSPSGLLLTPREEGGLMLTARWNWRAAEVPAIAMDQPGVQFFERTQFILDIDELRAGRATDIPPEACPRWLADDPDAWAMVPLVHYERLVGIVILTRPSVSRLLDWEDFDLLRIIGRQLASYLAEQTSQDALGEAQRFDEFNRRIAFVMHDIKNLASQLSLLARNAEKHADKAEFRADMILTLRNSTDKLQALLQRLGRYGTQGAGAHREFPVADLLARVAQQYEARHEVILLDRESFDVVGDAEALEQALVHLVLNAIEASPETSPVFIDLRKETASAVIEVVDSGCGMSPEFVRNHLFKPFHSSKQGGFGIGAFEARELVRAMGGRLDVESREGIGTRFVIRLPLAEATGLIDAMQSQHIINSEVA